MKRVYMKISILSDVHLGFGRGSEREGDSYDALAEALEKSLDSDLILIAGDMFDSSSPPAETLALAEEILLRSLLENGSVRILEGIGKDIKKLRLVNPGKPIIAIHGTHERRARGLLNPVQALERAGFLVYLHCNGVVVEKQMGPGSLKAKANGERQSAERICIQGMSGVPDQYAGNVLEEWNPRPREGCYNILMIHQSLKGFMHERVENQLDPGKINRGFDLYVCGHMHAPGESSLGGSRLIIPGGMVATQLREGERPLGFFKLDSSSGSSEFIELESQRRVYFLDAKNRGDLENGIREILKKRHERKPIIRVRLGGDFPVRELRERLGEGAILSLRKDSGELEETGAVGLEEQRLSVSELGRRLLRENLERQGLGPELFENIFELLLEGREGKALELLGEGGKDRPAEVKKKRAKAKGGDSGEWEGGGELGRFF